MHIFKHKLGLWRNFIQFFPEVLCLNLNCNSELISIETSINFLSCIYFMVQIGQIYTLSISFQKFQARADSYLRNINENTTTFFNISHFKNMYSGFHCPSAH